MTAVECPMCSCRAWAAIPLVGAYAAVCGTVWGDKMEMRQAEACEVIVRLRLELDLAQMAVAS